MLRCLAKRPDERPAGVVQVLITLEQLALSHPWSQAQAEAWWQDYPHATAGAAQENV